MRLIKGLKLKPDGVVLDWHDENLDAGLPGEGQRFEGSAWLKL